MSKVMESDLVERVVASVIVAVGTRYVVEVERELLMLRIQVLEKGSELGNVELLDDIESRLSRVNERMEGFSGEVLRVMQEVREELSGSTSLLQWERSEPMRTRKGVAVRQNHTLMTAV